MSLTTDAPVGMLGGTFDPIHFGHLRLAEEIIERCGLAQVRLVPVGRPPHRAEPGVSGEHRHEMVRLATSGNPRLVADDRELRREGPCYTVDTLAELRAELGTARSLVLIMGVDAFAKLDGWSRWQSLFGLAHIAVAHRPGYSLDVDAGGMAPAVRRELDTRRALPGDLAGEPAGRIAELAIPLLDISASAIRAKVGAGLGIRYLVPDAVAGYVNDHRLYRDGPQGGR